ncbi:NOT2 / NOT3 / NOT5 family domain containing protein [Lactarius tabidus]
MNRPGQPPQRPPSLGPTPIAGPFRGPPYPTYALPPRNIVAAYPTQPLQNHRATQNLVPQPNPGGFVQPRTPGGFAFGGANPQQQQSQPQQSHPQLPLPLHQQQQQPPTSAHPSLSHLQSTTPSLGGAGNGGGGTALSVSSTSELGLDPNDFPALGATPSTATSTSNPTPATSYASQAGTGVPPSGSTGPTSGGSALPRDFTADDFPALGGGPTPAQQQQQQQQQTQPTSHDSHPPGLGGLGNQQQQPGLLNLGPRALQSLQSESEKQRHNMKLNAAAQAAWNQPSTTTPSQTQAQSYQNGTQQQQSLHAPPGVPPPPSSFSQQQPSQQQGQGQAQAQGTPFVGNGNGNGAVATATGNGGGNAIGTDAQGQSTAPASAVAPVPQTPAQQVLMSAADRWGLLGLLAMIKNADPDQALLSVGTDLGTMGLDMQQQGNLYSTFITPWADSSAAHTVEPDFHLPGCYNVQPPAPGPGKAAAFSDETLFFMFYSSPRDALQEIASQELYNRNWRYHKELRIWLTKESGTAPSQKVPGGEQGTYTFWDPDNWAKERKEMVVLYTDLEEKTLTTPAPAPPPSAGAAAGAFAPGSVQQQQQQQGPPQLQQMQMGGMGQMGQIQPQVRGAFQGVSMAAM